MATRRQPLMSSNPALVLGIVVLLVFAIGGGAIMFALAPLVDSDAVVAEDAADSGPTTPGGPVNVTLVARNLAFDKRTIAASPGGDVTVKLDNQDSGVLHNLAFYTNRSAGTKIHIGATNTGPGSVTDTFKAPSSAGNYFFRCDAHPDQMTGTFVVK
jgi:plastocyanin